MFDDLERLHASAPLLQLLKHYALLGSADRGVWQDRLMHLNGVGPRELSRLHGELIAFGWIEQNSGVTEVLKPGVAAACYRITLQGQRAVKTTAIEAQAA